MYNDFDPSGVGVANGNYFSLPCQLEESMVALISIPWDVTVSYSCGASKAPAALLEASSQIDLYDSSAHNAWRKGIATIPIDNSIEELSSKMRVVAERIIAHLESGGSLNDSLAEDLKSVNQASESINESTYATAKELLNRGKIVGLVGGDHSTPYGLIKALGEQHSDFGILHIDAHRDLRCAYEGFDYSHASIMYNVLRDVESVSRLVQVGVRDFCDEEQEIAENDERVVSFEDMTLARSMFEGESWAQQCQKITESLPQKVYISFDIDGLEVSCCPNTGTPVCGGLSYNQVVYLLERVVASGRKIIGFDMVEVVPNSESVIDLVTGVRILYKLCGLSIKSNI